VQQITYDIAVFGYGELTSQLIQFFDNKSLKIACFSDRQINKKAFGPKIDLMKYSELINESIKCEVAIFSWKSTSHISGKNQLFLDWFHSNRFYARRSFFLSSASIYKDSFDSLNESKESLSLNVETHDKYILENYLLLAMKAKYTEHVNLRLSNVYGKSLSYGLIGDLINAFFENTELLILDNFDLIRDYLLLEDFLYALNGLIKLSNLPETLNISTNIGTTTRQLLQIFENYDMVIRYKTLPFRLNLVKLSSKLDCKLLESIIPWNPNPLEIGLGRILSDFTQ
jgi:nucleoside-diphosphate-sugar epimerase